MVARNLADDVPLALDDRERVAGGIAVGGCQQGFGLGQELELEHQVRGELLVVLSFHLALDGVEHVAGGLELRPHGVVLLFAAAAGKLPLVEQVAVGRHSVGTLRRERLSLLDQVLLLGTNVLVRAVELGKERLAVLLNRRAGRAKALPQVVGLALGNARGIVLVRLPLRKEGVEGSAGLLPLRLGRIFGGEALGLGHDLGPFGDGGSGSCFGLDALLLGELGDGSSEGAEAFGQGGQVADGVGVGHGDGEIGHRFGDIRGRSATLRTLLEQGDLPVELNVLAFEVGQGLFRSGIRVLADGAFAIRFAHVNRAGFVYATPWLLICRSQEPHLC